MIAKPFIERFRQSSSKITPQKNNDNDKFLLLFQLINKIPLGNETDPKRIADIIFRIFSPSSILITTNLNGSLKVEQAWQKPTLSSTTEKSSEIDNNIIGKPASAACELIKNTKQTQSLNDISQNYPNDPLLQRLGAKTYTGFPIFDEDNNVVTVIGLINNQAKEYSKFELDLLASITARMGQEINNKALNSSQLEANPKIEEKKDQIKESSNSQLKAELEAANKTLESISYTISHDLRAPLRSMDSFSQLLSEEFANNLPEEAINYLGRIRRAANRMGSMIDDLLWLSKVTRRKLEKQEINLSKAANNIINEIREKHIDYNCEFHTDPHLLVSADKNLIKIALQHLLNNACKFSRHKEKIVVSLSHFEQSGETVYKITDNGCGFDMNYYDQLFEPFKKLHDNSDYEGTGIGLATVKRIIQRHGGKIWAESEPDEGTSIFFTLGVE